MLKADLISKIESVFALVFFAAFCVYFIPSFNSEIRVHDTFDGNFSTRHVLVNSGHFFDLNPNGYVGKIMNGLPRGVFPRFTEITTVLMFLFGSLSGFAISFLLVKILAFAGIYLFGRDHVKMKPEQKALLLMISVAFACLPFYTIHGLSVAGIPLMLWAFFNIDKNQNKRISYLALILFVLWSNFVLVGLHAVILLGFLALYLSATRKKIQFRLFGLIFLMGTLYVLSEYMMFYLHYFDKSYESSRSEMERFLGLNFNGVIGTTALNFFTGHSSTANYLGYLMLPFFVFFGVAYWKNRKVEIFMQGFLFTSLTIAFSFLISLLDWKGFAFFYESFPFAKVFNFKRFTSLLPGLFFISALTAMIIANTRGSVVMRINSSVLLAVLCFFIWRGNISFNRGAFDTTGYRIISDQKVTFNEFFDPALYKNIKAEMGRDTIANVIHLGYSPSPSKYAGLSVLDDYQGDYPAEYKSEFRKIIAGELEKSEKLKQYFDNWGARCYLQSAALFEGREQTKSGFLYEDRLAINTHQLKNMNCSYIISSVLIGNSAELDLDLRKVLVSPTDFKKVLLYKIN